MSWFAIADKLSQTQCFERTRTGRCSHNKKGINPCDRTQNMMDACADSFSNGITPLEVIDHLASKRCRNKSCNHRGCTEIDQLVSNAVLPIAA